MNEFTKNTIIAAVAAVLAFTFSLLLELIKTRYQNKTVRLRLRLISQKSLQSALKILQAIRSNYDNNNYFDFIYLGQLEKVAEQLDSLRYQDQFFPRSVDQSTYFELVGQLLLLNANMSSIQQYEYNQDRVNGSDDLIIRKKQEYMRELSETIQKIESLINILED
jgi:hypothetical protein